MKAVKIAGIILAALIVLVLILGMFAPDELTVSRSAVILKPKEAVFPYVQYMKKREAWSPWVEMDPNMEQSYTGTDGEPGVVYSWQGNEDVGKGEQTLTAVEPLKRVESHITFIEPMRGEADDWVTLEDAETGTKVTWGFRQELSFPGNVFMLLAKKQVEEMLAADFEKGINKLKELVESESTSAYQVKEIAYPEHHFLAVRKQISMKDISAFYGESYGKIMAAMGKANIQPAGMPCGITYVWNEQAQTTDIAAAIPVAQATSLPGLESITLPASKALQVDYYGAYDQIGAAHYAIDAYVKAKGLQTSVPIIEEYVTDPGAEPDTSKWLTRVIYPLE